MSELPPPPGYRAECCCDSCLRWRRWIADRQSKWDRLSKATSYREGLEWPGLDDWPSSINSPAKAMILSAYDDE